MFYATLSNRELSFSSITKFRTGSSNSCAPTPYRDGDNLDAQLFLFLGLNIFLFMFKSSRHPASGDGSYPFSVTQYLSVVLTAAAAAAAVYDEGEMPGKDS